MQRDRARSLAVAGLALLAITLAAAILSGAVEAGPLQDFGLGNSEPASDPGSDAPSGGLFPGSGSNDGAFGLLCITHPLFVYGIPLFVLGVAALLISRFGSWAGSRLSAAFGLLVGIPYALLTACQEGRFGVDPRSGIGEVWNRAGSVVPSPSLGELLVVLLVASAGIALAAAIYYLASRSGSAGESSGFPIPLAPEPPNPTSDLAGVADAAGKAAERIESEAPVDNEVYRAWREMTEYLDVDAPESSTPGEFADAAIAEGLDPDRVASLTDVFQRVRYGDAEPELYEADAVSALRSIEEDATAAEEN